MRLVGALLLASPCCTQTLPLRNSAPARLPAALLDAVGREVALYNVMALQGDRAGLAEFVRATGAAAAGPDPPGAEAAEALAAPTASAHDAQGKEAEAEAEDVDMDTQGTA